MVSCGPTYEKTDLVQMYDMGDMRGPLPIKMDDPESISGSYKNISEIIKELLATLRRKGSEEILKQKSG